MERSGWRSRCQRLNGSYRVGRGLCVRILFAADQDNVLAIQLWQIRYCDLALLRNTRALQRLEVRGR